MRVKPRFLEHRAELRLAGLRAEREADLLRERRRRTDERRHRVEEPADRIQVVLDAVAGERLDEEPGAVRCERLADVARGADRVAHVVQAIEARDQVVAGAGKRLGRGDLEADAIGDAGVARPLARPLDRRRVVVEADEGRARERLGENDRRGAEPAADVGDARAAAELLLHAVERRNPVGDEVRVVAGPEEALDADEEVGVVLVPADAAAAREALGHLAVGPHRGGHAWNAPSTQAGLSSSVRQAACAGGSV